MNKKTILLAALSLSVMQSEAQSVLTIADNSKSVSASEAGKYDAVKAEWQMEANTMYLVSFPARLDGYYFGQDAPRAKVVSYTKTADESYEIVTSNMPDLDDFLPNQVYVVTPKVNIDAIFHLTPGIKTEAVATPAGKELMHEKNKSDKTGIADIVTDGSNQLTPVYDLQGRKVSVLQKGATYIIGNKKVIIK